MNLSALLIPEGASPRPTAAQQNEVLKLLLRATLLGEIPRLQSPSGFPHPWRVKAQRFEPPEGVKTLLTSENTWRVDVAAGTVNDTLAAIMYQTKDDPRGWSAPPADDPSAPVPLLTDREQLDDPDDPPFLVLRDPVANAATADDFQLVSDSERPDAFKGESDWELELWQAHVILSAATARVSLFPPTFPPPKLARYRLYSLPKLPTSNFAAQAGGWRELATLYLLRDPATPSEAELFVRQRVWWPLWASIVQPGKDVAELASLISADLNLIIPGWELNVDNVLESAATVEWWTV